MIVSWDWLAQYVDLKMSHDELVDRLTTSGLNHEGTEQSFGDQAIDLEVTSNRPDCLGHIGVAREISVLFELPLTVPDPQPEQVADSVANHVSVDIQSPELCYRYTARLLKDVKVGPSPDWIADRLKAIGVAVINNVVDATNYVMFECGQPLHAFDFGKINDGNIIVRNAQPNETFLALDHKNYKLDPKMCMIADTKSPVAIGGVMGGADSEVSDDTTDVLIEAAHFAPLSVRNTARTLKLFSPSSFRFERSIDDTQMDWASKRCCELIMQSGGGRLLGGMVDSGKMDPPPQQVVLRLSQLERILGIKIPDEFSRATLAALGLNIDRSDSTSITVTPPGWRKDLTREVDLIEEVGRIYGYDKVPDVEVPMAASRLPDSHRVLDRIRAIMTGNGFDEIVTTSLVPKPWCDAFSPWTDNPSLITTQPMLGVLEKFWENKGSVEHLRPSLVPSLIEARRINEYRSNADIELFETAKVYLTKSETELPDQPTHLAMVSGHDYYYVKGVIESIVGSLNQSAKIESSSYDIDLLDVNYSCQLLINGNVLGYVGQVSESGKTTFGLRTNATVAELNIAELEKLSVLVPLHSDQSQFPSVARDFNFIVDNSIHWSKLESTVSNAGGELLEDVVYRETFRDEKKDGADKKRLLLSVILRSSDATLTGAEADEVCTRIVDSCKDQLNASLVV